MYYVRKIIIETSLNARSLYFISKRKRYFTLFYALQFDRNIYIYISLFIENTSFSKVEIKFLAFVRVLFYQSNSSRRLNFILTFLFILLEISMLVFFLLFC